MVSRKAKEKPKESLKRSTTFELTGFTYFFFLGFIFESWWRHRWHDPKRSPKQGAKHGPTVQSTTERQRSHLFATTATQAQMAENHEEFAIDLVAVAAWLGAALRGVPPRGAATVSRVSPDACSGGPPAEEARSCSPALIPVC